MGKIFFWESRGQIVEMSMYYQDDSGQMGFASNLQMWMGIVEALWISDRKAMVFVAPDSDARVQLSRIRRNMRPFSVGVASADETMLVEFSGQQGTRNRERIDQLRSRVSGSPVSGKSSHWLDELLKPGVDVSTFQRVLTHADHVQIWHFSDRGENCHLYFAPSRPGSALDRVKTIAASYGIAIQQVSSQADVPTW